MLHHSLMYVHFFSAKPCVVHQQRPERTSFFFLHFVALFAPVACVFCGLKIVVYTSKCSVVVDATFVHFLYPISLETKNVLRLLRRTKIMLRVLICPTLQKHNQMILAPKRLYWSGIMRKRSSFFWPPLPTQSKFHCFWLPHSTTCWVIKTTLGPVF